MFEDFSFANYVFFGCACAAIAISICFICYRIVYRLWCFVDDKDEIEKIEIGEYVVGNVILAGAMFGLSVFLCFLHVAWIEFVVYVPVYVYMILVVLALSIYTLRYVRRTHKAIHGHVNNEDAHSDKEKSAPYIAKLNEENGKYERY